jgi:hypothetical protein
MNTREIKELLEKYYEGETSLADEKALKDFFLSAEVPSELEGYKSQFLYFAEASGDEISDREFEEKVFAKRNVSPVVPLHPGRNRLYYISGIAATILLLIGLVFTFREDVFNRQKVNGTTTDPELVFSQTRDILALVSVNFNKGMDKMQYLGQFDRGMEKMQMLSKFYQYETLFINPDPITGKSIKSNKK